MCTDDRRSIPESRPFFVHHLSPLVFLAFLTLYSATLMPDVLPADAGEFQRVAATASVAHPPGYPLYTMLGWLFSRLPFARTPAWRVNFFSAVTAAATGALVFHTARRMTDSAWGGLAAALTLGSATTFWATATQASIRPLTAFFTALCLDALTLHSRCKMQDAGCDDRSLVLFMVALSLGLVHHPSLAFPAAAFVLYLVLIDPGLLRQPRRWLKPLLTFALGLLVLIYLPLRGGAELRTLPGFLEHVLARGFRGDMFALNLFDRLVLLPTLLRFQFNLPLLLAAFAGAALLLWRDRKLALLLIGSFFVHTAVTLTYDAPQTVEYLMPAYVPLALLVGRFAGLQVGKRARWAVLALVLIAGCANLAEHWPSYRALSQSRDARDYAEGLLREAPEEAVILSNWHWFTPMQYLQRVEELRPDLKVEYVAPRGEPLAQTWVRAIEEHVSERPVIVVRYFEREYGQLPYSFEPLGEAFLVRAEPRSAMPSGLRPLDVTLGRFKLLGYRSEAEVTEPARPLALTLAWRPAVTPTKDVALFAQLIGPDGGLWSAARDRRHEATRLTAGEVVAERFVIYPLLHAPPGEYSLVVGAYLPGEPGAPRITAADGSDVVRLMTVQLHPATTRPATAHPLFVRFAGGPRLIGVDYEPNAQGGVRTYLHWAGPGDAASLTLMGREDALFTTGRVPALERGQYVTLAFDRSSAADRVSLSDEDGLLRWNLLFSRVVWLPAPQPGERYVPFGDGMVLTGCDGPVVALEPGAEATLNLRFRARRPLERDYIISAALIGLNEDGTWAWRDSRDGVPALGAIPTLKWIQGAAIRDPRRLTVPPDAPVTPIVGSLTVYDHFTQAPLPPLDERGGPVVSLGSW